MVSGAVGIRAGRPEDLPRLAELLDHFALNSTASFDTEPVPLDRRRAWFATFADRGPHRLLVATRDGALLGAAYSAPYRSHPAFRETVEVSVVVAPDHRAERVGSMLYAELFRQLDTENVHVALAGIALANDASIALHRRFGFREVGVFHEYAVRRGCRVSSLWMERVRPAGGESL